MSIYPIYLAKTKISNSAMKATDQTRAHAIARQVLVSCSGLGGLDCNTVSPIAMACGSRVVECLVGV